MDDQPPGPTPLANFLAKKNSLTVPLAACRGRHDDIVNVAKAKGTQVGGNKFGSLCSFGHEILVVSCRL